MTGPYLGTLTQPRSPDTAPIAALTTKVSGKDRAFFRSAAELIADAADALEHAHSLGIVHRDVKPGNLLIDNAGKLYVGDFGLARFGPDVGLTMSGDLLGTLRYMAPEQALARHGLADHRVDVYGLGCTLYELLTGKPAVGGTDKADILRRLAFEEPVSLRKLDKAIPAELETIALKCLAKNPNERYATAGELAADLRRFADDKPIQAKPPGPIERAARWARRHKHFIRTLAAVCGVSVISLAVMTYLIWQKADVAQRAYQTETRERERAEANLATAMDAVERMLEQVGDRKLANVPQMEKLRAEMVGAAADFYQKLRQTHGDALSIRFATARAYGTLSNLQTDLGRLDESVRTCRQAVEVMRGVVADDPGNPKYRCQLAMVINDLAAALNETGQLAEAEAGNREAIAIQEPLVQANPGNRDYRLFLANMQFNLGMILHRTGRQAEAEPWYQQAVDGHAELVRRLPSDRSARNRLAECRLGYGWLLETTGRRTDAEAEFRLARALADGLLRETPRNQFYRSTACWACLYLGVELVDTGRLPEAEAVLEKGIGVGDRLVADYPHTPLYTTRLCKLYALLRDVLRKTNRPNEAANANQRLAALYTKLVADFPNDPTYRREAAALGISLGDAARPAAKPEKR